MSMIGSFMRVREQVIRDLHEDPEQIAALLGNSDETNSLDIDKTWHGLHFLLTGEAWEGKPPLNFIVSGGEPIGDVDVGYGPARGFLADDVRAIAAALASIDVTELRKRFEPAAMIAEEIYPSIWDQDPATDDAFPYLAEHYEALKRFVAEAAEADLGLIVYCS